MKLMFFMTYKQICRNNHSRNHRAAEQQRRHYLQQQLLTETMLAKTSLYDYIVPINKHYAQRLHVFSRFLQKLLHFTKTPCLNTR